MEPVIGVVLLECYGMFFALNILGSMPTSTYAHIPIFVKFLLAVRPSSILDIGVGNGKMGFIARDLLDVMIGERFRREDWKIRIDGIEVFERYIQDHQRSIYDRIYIGDALEVIERLGDYDLIILGDVLEHLEKDRAWTLLDRCAAHCRDSIILHIPLGEGWHQPALHGNPHEEHRSFWKAEELEPFATERHLFDFGGLGHYGAFLIDRERYVRWRSQGKGRKERKDMGYSSRIRVLTFNWHESYIHLLSKTGYSFDVVERWKGGRFGWIREFRPVPPNCRLISEEEAKEGLREGRYDRVICHNMEDLLFVRDFKVPKILVFHNRLSTEIALGGYRTEKDRYLEQVRHLFDSIDDLHLVFISEAKKRDWGLEGEVILPGIDPSEYGGWRGDLPKVLRVGNLIKERDIMLGHSIQERILGGLPSTILGLNPSLPGSHIPRDWEDLKDHMRDHRVYLNTTVYPYEDGYNLALLEAMAVGMPVVSLSNPTSPIEDGVNGFVSPDEGYLRERVEELLRNRDLALNLGRKAREAVTDLFPIERFVEKWKTLLEGTPRPQRRSEKRTSRLKILMAYTSNPQTTAAYLERALRKDHEVVTFGPTIPEKVLKAWNLEGIKERVRDHDIPYFTSDMGEVLKRLPWTPDLFLWVETGVWFDMKGLEDLPCLKVCYLIDNHLNLPSHLEIARSFDVVFIAQRAYLERFREKGVEAYWLPLACDPEIHGKREGEKIYDISFVGSLNNPKRVEVIELLKERFNLHYERCFLEEMAEVFSRSKIVFNISARDDLNMRVFEALCSGSMLLTDEARGSGLTDLFEDREHLVIYRDERELVELASYYLREEKEREEIARRGMEEVLKRHTYQHRVKEMVERLRPFLKTPSKKASNPAPDYFRQERRDVEALIPEGIRRVLDIGCGEGILGRRLLRKGVEEVIGIEVDPSVAKRAEGNLSRVICGDVEDVDLPFEEGYFDCIILADILEHLRDPLSVLLKVKRVLSDSGCMVISIPNVRYWGVIDMLVEGRWKYEDQGIMDRTHLRFFTFKEMEDLLRDAGLHITGKGANKDPLFKDVDLSKGRISFGRVTLEGLTPDEVEDLFVVQYLIRAEKVGVERERIEALLKEGALDRAREVIEDHLLSHPGDIWALCRHGEVCLDLGLVEKAVESLEKALLLDPDSVEATRLKEKVYGKGAL